MSKLSTDNLYHYTRKFECLINITKNGFEFRRCEEDLPLTGYPGSPLTLPGVIKYFIYPEVVCFCDIPFNLVNKHILQYGEYCIGLTKEWGMSNGITPIRYVHYETPDLTDNQFRNIKNCADNFHNFNNSML